MSNYYSKVFDKCVGFINWKLLRYWTFKLDTDYRSRELNTQQHLANMLYYNLTGKESLNHLHDGLKAKKSLHHILKPVSLASLSNNNRNRDFRVFIPIFNDLVSKATDTLPINKKLKKFGKIKALDATTISFCKTYFKWAVFRKNKSGIKIHTLYNVQQQFPEDIKVTTAKVHEKNLMKDLMWEKDCIHLIDKGYIDYKVFDELSQNGIYFVTRLRDNAVFTEVDNRAVTFSGEHFIDSDIDIFYDKEVYLGSEANNTRTQKTYRIIKIEDIQGQQMVFVTNIFNLTSEDIAYLYKKRWDIEIFFKWMKQHIKINQPIGHSFNAIMIQIITAMITYIILTLISKDCCYTKELIRLKRVICENIDCLVDSNSIDWISNLDSS